MGWQTNPAAMALRSVLRRAGLTKLIGGLLRRGSYEEAFDVAFLACIQPGDCVWDIGANVGYYTTKVCDRVGDTGHVFAFEPSSTNRVQLAEALVGRANSSIVPMALGKETSVTFLQQGDDEIGATSRVVEESSTGAERVEIAQADDLLRRSIVAQPQVVKIDTEGYELDVLEGMSEILSNHSLRCVGVEIHFGLLQQRGLQNAPREIERILGEAGLKPHWTDTSHIIATR